jgi:hypothetical protein
MIAPTSSSKSSFAVSCGHGTVASGPKTVSGLPFQ